MHFPLHHLIVYGVGRWGEREGYGFPLINCHSFPGYFVRKTCPGEKEFLLALALKHSSYPEIGKGILLPSWPGMEYTGPFLWFPPAAEGAGQGIGPGEALTGLGTPLGPAYLPHPGCKRPPLSWLCTGLLPPQVKASGPP